MNRELCKFSYQTLPKIIQKLWIFIKIKKNMKIVHKIIEF